MLGQKSKYQKNYSDESELFYKDELNLEGIHKFFYPFHNHQIKMLFSMNIFKKIKS